MLNSLKYLNERCSGVQIRIQIKRIIICYLNELNYIVFLIINFMF